VQQVKCIKAFGNASPGDVAEVGDGAMVDPEHWEVVIPAAPPPAAVKLPAPPAAPVAGTPAGAPSVSFAPKGV
jgi:hypothetical protein